MKKKKIGIYNYPSSNSFSLISALDNILVEHKVSSNIDDLLDLKKIIIPGVGNMKSFFYNITPKLFAEKLKSFTKEGGTIYGICLGMQALLNKSSEGNIETLNIIEGKTMALSEDFKTNMNVGFKKINYEKDELIFNKLFNGIENESLYFLHKYHCIINDNKIKTIHAKYENKNIVAGLYSKKILGTQFHPELSGRPGLQFLNNFCNLNFDL
ncbi:imidazole glycerol phosphate synthase subunit HisH [Candidatus Pelagibacter sp.]|jgi:glutamine amidotransferase|nr:imidazole glycerol phosphate synthase subunit HisH [Candidatus Pelagibacter sp.]